jgi:hypothetical protein
MLFAKVAQESEHVVNELPISPEAFGVLGFAMLMGLLFVTFAFRSVGTRH